MRIIIDLLGAQIELQDNHSDVYFSEVMQWLNENNIENFYLILHANISDTEQIIRRKIKNKLNIKKFFGISIGDTVKNKRANEELYLRFINSLSPSAIIIDKKIKNENIYNILYKNKKLKNILFNSSSLPKQNKLLDKRTLKKKNYSSKLKLAFVSPLPPEKTGIAAYSAVLAKSL